MISRDGEAFAVSCDECGDGDIHETDDFGEVIAEIKREGWQIRHGAQGWVHKCPDCAKGARRQRRML